MRASERYTTSTALRRPIPRLGTTGLGALILALAHDGIVRQLGAGGAEIGSRRGDWVDESRAGCGGRAEGGRNDCGCRANLHPQPGDRCELAELNEMGGEGRQAAGSSLSGRLMSAGTGCSTRTLVLKVFSS